jgi:cullin 1
VNNNAVTKGSKSSRTPELLAKYCDSLLKRSSKNEDQQLEAIFVDIMIIFRYVDDKDVFEKFYKKFLANRLVGAKSVSDDAETSMISKLKVGSLCARVFLWLYCDPAPLSRTYAAHLAFSTALSGALWK